RGKPITERALAGILKPFKISPRTIYPPEHPKGVKGYLKAEVEEACARYLPRKGPEGPEIIQPQALPSDFQRSGNGSYRRVEKVEEPPAALALPDVPDLWTPEVSRVHEFPDMPDCLRLPPPDADSFDDDARCAQCGEDDGKTARYHDGLWFHRVCRTFWLRSH